MRSVKATRDVSKTAIVYVIGPSGSGKSTLCSELAETLKNVHHIDLDKGPRGDRDAKVRWAMEVIECLESTRPQGVHLVDVGAFFQFHIDNRFWLARSRRSISIQKTLDDCFANHLAKDTHKPRHNRKRFEMDEFCEQRRILYESARLRISANRPIEDTLDDFRNAIEIVTGVHFGVSRGDLDGPR